MLVSSVCLCVCLSVCALTGEFITYSSSAIYRYKKKTLQQVATGLGKTD